MMHRVTFDIMRRFDYIVVERTVGAATETSEGEMEDAEEVTNLNGTGSDDDVNGDVTSFGCRVRRT